MTVYEKIKRLFNVTIYDNIVLIFIIFQMIINIWVISFIKGSIEYRSITSEAVINLIETNALRHMQIESLENQILILKHNSFLNQNNKDDNPIQRINPEYYRM